MSRGGARNRSGPQPDPSSLRSGARGLVFTALPREGYDGDAPEFPLPSPSVRELDVWAEAWTTPQAAAWITEDWRWPIIGEYVRIKVICECDSEPSASLVGQLHRYRDQLGLTPAGLRENGWALAKVEVGPATARPAEGDTPAAPRSSSRDRLRVVGGEPG